MFAIVALATETDTLNGRAQGRRQLVVLIASDRPIDVVAVQAASDRRVLTWSVITGAELRSWIGDAPVLTDDYAPVDQLLTPYPTRRLATR